MFSKTCKYGIRAVLFIAHSSQKDKRVGLPEIAEEIDSPKAFTAKIMQLLSRAGIITSIKGPNGGFEMSEKQRKNNSIKSIVEVLDGDDLYKKCGLGLHKCNDDHPCPMHEEYKEVRSNLIKLHNSLTIANLARQLEEDAVLK